MAAGVSGGVGGGSTVTIPVSSEPHETGAPTTVVTPAHNAPLPSVTVAPSPPHPAPAATYTAPSTTPSTTTFNSLQASGVVGQIDPDTIDPTDPDAGQAMKDIQSKMVAINNSIAAFNATATAMTTKIATLQQNVTTAETALAADPKNATKQATYNQAVASLTTAQNALTGIYNQVSSLTSQKSDTEAQAIAAFNRLVKDAQGNAESASAQSATPGQTTTGGKGATGAGTTSAAPTTTGPAASGTTTTTTTTTAATLPAGLAALQQNLVALGVVFPTQPGSGQQGQGRQSSDEDEGGISVGGSHVNT